VKRPHLIPLLLTAGVSMSLLGGGCMTTRNEGLVLDSRLDYLENRVNRIDADFPGIKEFTDSGRKEMARISHQQAELLSQLEEIKQVVMSLGGKLEEGENLFTRMAGLEKQLQQLSDRITALEEIISPGRGEIDASKLDPGWENEESGYRDAYSTYEAKQYILARAKFEKLLELFPRGQFADNARYWIGECHYGLKDYERAILNFNEVIEKYPQSVKVPNAYLKLGLSFLEMGKKKEAKIALETLIAKFPKSEPAGIAREKLKKAQ